MNNERRQLCPVRNFFFLIGNFFMRKNITRGTIVQIFTEFCAFCPSLRFFKVERFRNNGNSAFASFSFHLKTVEAITIKLSDSMHLI